MEHEVDLVLTLCGALTAALLFGFAAQKLRLSPIAGYLVAGVAVGPFTPGFVAHEVLAAQFAELGVVLLLFGVGLNLHLEELLQVKRIALPGGLAGILAATLAGFFVSGLFGWPLAARLVFGIAVSVSSTVVLLRVFADRDLLPTSAGRLAVGWLLVEDLLVVLVVVLLPLVVNSRTGGDHLALLRAVALALAKIAAFVAITLFVGKRAIPAALARVAETHSRELFTLAVLVIALGVAVLAAKVGGASMALGAFLAGLVVGQSDLAARAASDALPMRDAFAVLFFVATGMLLDPSQILPNAPACLATLAVVLLAKPLVVVVMMRAFRYPLRNALQVALGLGQIGEFSFVVAGLGVGLGILPKEATQLLVMTSFVTITLCPLGLRLAEPVARRLRPRLPPREKLHIPN